MIATTAPSLVDLSPLAEPERAAALLTAFDRLEPGAFLVLATEGPPAALLACLQAERKGLFEWSPLQAGPASHRTLVTRRQAQAGAAREVNEALAWDHDRLDALEQRTFELVAAQDLAGACAAWAEFVFGLKRHIRFEEELLFPAFERACGVPPERGPTAVMRLEHRDIEALIDAIGEALEDGFGAPSLRASLHDVLGQHNEKEEHVLYPATDRALSAEERDALVARIQAS